ncbi:MAG: hydroxymethylglutaryl-CoA lyase [Bacteroidota bacterium]
MDQNNLIKLTESPRDAQQGLPYVIPPEKRATYINALLRVGFDVIDFGSFVSPKAIPQMAEAGKVLNLVTKDGSHTKLMAIVGNLRGGTEAAAQLKLDIIGFPYSTSETFLLKNIHADKAKANEIINGLQTICKDNGKELRVFISLAFGNPYNDPWNIDILSEHIGILARKGITTVTLADTIGIATAPLIGKVYSALLRRFPGMEFGLHLHTRPGEWHAKLSAAWDAGCRWFEGVLNGTGGCPMTGYELVGNLDTRNLLVFLNEKQVPHRINNELLMKAVETGY